MRVPRRRRQGSALACTDLVFKMEDLALPDSRRRNGIAMADRSMRINVGDIGAQQETRNQVPSTSATVWATIRANGLLERLFAVT